MLLRSIAAAFTVAVMAGLTYVAGLRGAAISAVVYWGFELLLSVLFVRCGAGYNRVSVRVAPRRAQAAAALAAAEEGDA